MRAEDILRYLDPDFSAGTMRWNSTNQNRTRVEGKEAGCIQTQHNGKNYCFIRVEGKLQKRARLMYAAFHGYMPDGCIDHINGESLDDRIVNLREATPLQNRWNQPGRPRTLPLPTGVMPASGGRFSARIGFKGTRLRLGFFDSPEEASRAYQEKRKELFGEFA